MSDWDQKFKELNSAKSSATAQKQPGEERNVVLTQPVQPDTSQSDWEKKFKELNSKSPLTEEQKKQAGGYVRPGLERFLDPLNLSGKYGSVIEGVIEKKPGQSLKSSIFEQAKAGTNLGDVVERVLPGNPDLPPLPGQLNIPRPVLRAAVTTGAEILTDPITYAGSGLTKAGKAAELLNPRTARIVEPLAEQAARGERAILQMGGKSVLPKSVNVAAYKQLDKLRTAYREGSVYKKFGRYFHSPTGHPITDILASNARDTKNYLENEYLGRYVKAKKQFTKDALKAGMDENTFNKAVLSQIEKPSEMSAPLVKNAANKLRTINDEVFKIEREAGLWTNELQGDIDYWARIVSDEGKKLLKKENAGFWGAKEWKDTHASQLERKFSKDMTLSQANAQMKPLMEKAGLEGDFFITDPFVTGSIRAARAARAIKSRQFIDATTGFFLKNGEAELISGSSAKKIKDIAESRLLGDKSKGLYIEKRDLRRGLERLAGSNDSELKSGAEALQGLLDTATEGQLVDLSKLDLEKMPGANKALQYLAKNQHNIYVMPEEVAGELNKVRGKMYTGITPVDMILKGHDAATNWLRRWTLGIFPQYHARNIVGNVSNNWLAGITDPSWYSDAMRLQYLGREGSGDLAKIGGHEAEIIDAMRRRGVINQGWYGADVEKSVMDRVKKTTLTGAILPGKQNVLMKGGEQVGTFFENNARIAHFLAKVDEGTKAAREAGKELSPDLLNTIYDNAAMSVKKYLFDYQDLTDFEKQYLKRFTFFYTWFKKNAMLQFENIVKQPGKYAAIEKTRRNIEGISDEPRQPDKYVAKWIKDNYPVRVRRDKDGTEYFAMLGGWLPMAQILQFVHPEELLQGNITGNAKEIGRELSGMGAPIEKEIVQQLANYDFFWESAIDRGTPDNPEYSKYLGLDMPQRVKHALRGVRLLNEVDKMFFLTGEGTPTAQDRATNFLAGFKTYPQDPIRGMEYYNYQIRTSLDNIDYLIKKYGRQVEQGRRTPESYQKRIEELMQERDKWIQEGQQLEQDQNRFRESKYFEERLRNRNAKGTTR